MRMPVSVECVDSSERRKITVWFQRGDISGTTGCFIPFASLFSQFGGGGGGMTTVINVNTTINLYFHLFRLW